ncbi:beta-lactamase/transpeptidase-like protein, partial [Rhizoclosmatium globosum]
GSNTERILSRKATHVLSLLLLAIVLSTSFVFHLADSATQPTTSTFSRLASEIESLRLSFRVPGVAVGVVVNGTLVFSQGFGTRNSSGARVGAQTLFQIGSTTKAFTAFAAAQLVDANLLSWTEPVTKTYPAVGFMDPVANEQANLVDIMSHRTGLPRHDIIWLLWSTHDEVIARIKDLQPSEEFRKVWQYNNIMFTLAGTIAGNVSGLGYEALVQERILGPLGMNSTQTNPYELPLSENHARGFVSNGWSNVEIPYDKSYMAGSSLPAGGISSNINDLAKWVSLMTNKGSFRDGQSRIISEEQFNMIITPHMPLENGLGWELDFYRDLPRIQHGGNTPGYSTQIDTFPTLDAAIIVLTNLEGTMAPIAIANTIADRLFFPAAPKNLLWKRNVEAIKKIIGRKWFTRPSLAFEAYEGRYRSKAHGDLSLRLRHDKKYFDFSLAGSNSLDGVVGHWQDDTFGVYELLGQASYVLPILELVFSVDATEGVDPIVFVRE